MGLLKTIRRRGVVLKILVLIPLTWFCIVIGLAYQNYFYDSQALAPEKSHGAREARSAQTFSVNYHREGDRHVLLKPPTTQKQFKPRVSVHDDNPSQEPDYPEPPNLASPDSPGEMGNAVVIDKNKLDPSEKGELDMGWQHNAFNDFASRKISLHRRLPDMRDPECKSVKYPDPMPDTSVIICFHNEAWTVLLRTMHSVIDKSPPKLLKEIILVDDFSNMDHLKAPLEDYIRKNKHRKVKVVRTKKREGLIRARLLGASVATGQVLTYLDSHCEATEGWLEPLIGRIAEDRHHVVAPLIEIINDENFEFRGTSARNTQMGIFKLDLEFNWKFPSPDEVKRRSDHNTWHHPLRTPTMAGGLFAISRQYFEEIGSYDSGMDIWGGENLEMSFRVWMCGGTLEIVPCSHVGHIFRKRSPYQWLPGVNVVKKNSVRLAEVWMDDYKKYYYERFNFDLGEYGDVSARKALRKKLKCKSFDWYIKNIYPELFIPGEALASGDVCNKVKSMCLDSPTDTHSLNKPIKLWPKHNQGGNQFWMLSKSGEIRRDEGCMDFAGQGEVMIWPCHSQRGNQEWIYQPDNTILHKNTNNCMELSANGDKLIMSSCTGVDRQIWQWKRKQ